MIRSGLVVSALALAIPSCSASAGVPDFGSSSPMICPQGGACSPCGDGVGEEISAGETAPVPAPVEEGHADAGAGGAR